ncbi:MAG: hypothetical protein LUH17_02215 [Acidaminococcaceae bacterium]|nr:hypothetical protein [Acidaminococcaceae bacterium]
MVKQIFIEDVDKAVGSVDKKRRKLAVRAAASSLRAIDSTGSRSFSCNVSRETFLGKDL